MKKRINGLTPKEYARDVALTYITGWDGGGLDEEDGVSESDYDTVSRHVGKFLDRAAKAIAKAQKKGSAKKERVS